MRDVQATEQIPGEQRNSYLLDSIRIAAACQPCRQENVVALVLNRDLDPPLHPSAHLQRIPRKLLALFRNQKNMPLTNGSRADARDRIGARLALWRKLVI